MVSSGMRAPPHRQAGRLILLLNPPSSLDAPTAMSSRSFLADWGRYKPVFPSSLIRSKASLISGTSEIGARLRSIGRARKWLRGSRPARLRVIEVAGVEREDGLKAQSDPHSQSRCRAR